MVIVKIDWENILQRILIVTGLDTFFFCSNDIISDDIIFSLSLSRHHVFLCVVIHLPLFFALLLFETPPVLSSLE